MRFFAAFICLILLSVAAYGAPSLSDPFPKNGGFAGGGNIHFTVNITPSSLDSSNVVLFVISKNAFDVGESWDRFVMQCTSITAQDWKCSRIVSFAIAGSDTLE